MNALMNVPTLEHVHPSWKPVLTALWAKYGGRITEILCGEGAVIYPKVDNVFEAFRLCSLDDLKVVILGMDPYIHPGEAHGLAFSVAGKPKKMPPSLRNIFKELAREYGVTRRDMNLTDWAQQGVLLLNTSLTVRMGETGSHIKVWKDFMTEFMKWLGGHTRDVVFLLWGNHAIGFEKWIDKQHNLVLTHTHPSPLSRKPFVGNAHFTTCNAFLEERGKVGVLWV